MRLERIVSHSVPRRTKRGRAFRAVVVAAGEAVVSLEITVEASLLLTGDATVFFLHS